MIRLILALIVLIAYNQVNASLKSNELICDPNLKAEEWPLDKIASNARFILESSVRLTQTNATQLEECIQLCCASNECNYAFFKDMTTCFLVQCVSECQLVENYKKTQSDPVDYFIEIKPFKPTFECDETSNTSCSLNEVCIQGKCVCPKELNYMRIDKVCREYLHKSAGCSLFLSECKLNPNEECVALNSYARHGTCQCKLGYKRDPETFLCKEHVLPLADLDEVAQSRPHDSNKRKRPDLKTQSLQSEAEDPLLNEIIKDLDQQITNSTTTQPTVPLTKSTSTSTISSSTTTATTTLSTTTEPIKITTKDLIAFAGNDQHIYYPSQTCILDGSLTRYYGENGNEGITKWLWLKHDSSPAFGRFLTSNERPTAVYEQLTEGVYKFILKVWSDTNEFSQDTVHVYVHSNLNTTTNSSLPNVTKLNDYLNANLVQIELDILPNKFTELHKRNFLQKLEIILQQNNLNEPQVLLIQTHVSRRDTKSRVILDILISESIKDLTYSKVNSDESIFSVDYLKRISDFETKSQFKRIVSNGNVIQFLKKNHRIYSLNEFFGLKITQIGQVTCMSCSNHGTCDSLTQKCVCHKYWMPNLFRYYFQNEYDLTNGNNCEWYSPLVYALLALVGVLVLVALGTLLKWFLFYFFYILCCCCCCSGKRNRKESMNDDFRKNKMKKYNKYDLYLEEKLNALDSDEEDDEFDPEMQHKLINKYKRSTLNKLKNKLKNVPVFRSNKNIKNKYALLNDEDETRLTKNKGDRMGAKLNLDETELDKNNNIVGNDDDEDVVFEKTFNSSILSPPDLARQKQSTNSGKKNNLNNSDYIREYKTII